MSEQEVLKVLVDIEKPSMAKPGIPLEKPKRRAVPDVPSPLRRKPIRVEPVRTPSEPVPVRR